MTSDETNVLLRNKKAKKLHIYCLHCMFFSLDVHAAWFQVGINLIIRSEVIEVEVASWNSGGLFFADVCCTMNSEVVRPVKGAATGRASEELVAKVEAEVPLVVFLSGETLAAAVY